MITVTCVGAISSYIAPKYALDFGDNAPNTPVLVFYAFHDGQFIVGRSVRCTDRPPEALLPLLLGIYGRSPRPLFIAS